MRRLVICADGTWNRSDDDRVGVDASTNVVKLARGTKPVASDGTDQIVYYHVGVGTGEGTDKITGGAFGEGLDGNVRDCYRFLAQNYNDDDELYFFGFSRGAYTVRSLAGFIRNAGLLNRGRLNLETEAYEMYRDRRPDTHPNGATAIAFRAANSREVRIKCIGVWDTVGALGIPVTFLDRLIPNRHQFHDVTLSSRVENALHALAIDERRKPFAPTLWEQPVEDMGKNWLEQAWFPGVHSNVGGGYPDSGLSDIALRWMVERVKDRCPLEFDDAYFASILKPSPTGRLFDSMNTFYRALGPLDRALDAAAKANQAKAINTWEYVHVETKARMSAAITPTYNPKNLTQYLSRTDARVLAALQRV
jgi:uncharacterized protein (DUF2235 family)